MGVKKVPRLPLEVMGKRLGYDDLAGGGSNILSPDVLSGFDFYAAHRKNYFSSPEQRLRYEALSDGIAQVLKGQKSALEWVRAMEEDYVFGFVFLCEEFNIDVKKLAAYLEQKFSLAPKHNIRAVIRRRGTRGVNTRVVARL